MASEPVADAFAALFAVSFEPVVTLFFIGVAETPLEFAVENADWVVASAVVDVAPFASIPTGEAGVGLTGMTAA